MFDTWPKKLINGLSKLNNSGESSGNSTKTIPKKSNPN